MPKDKFSPDWDDSDDTVGKKAREDAVKHYEDAHYRQEFTPNPADDSMMGHNQIVWLQNECKRLVKERDEMQALVDKVKLENNNLYTRVADALEVNEHHHNLNGKLQTRVTDLEEENQKMHEHLDKQVQEARKGGM